VTTRCCAACTHCVHGVRTQRAHVRPSRACTCNARAALIRIDTRAMHDSDACTFWVGGTPTRTPSGDDPFGGSLPGAAAGVAAEPPFTVAAVCPCSWRRATPLPRPPPADAVPPTLWGKPRRLIVALPRTTAPHIALVRCGGECVAARAYAHDTRRFALLMHMDVLLHCGVRFS